MDGRKRLSGAEYRKLSEVKKKKESEVIAKTMKLDSFFKISAPSPSSTEQPVDKSGEDQNIILEHIVINDNEIDNFSAQQPHTSNAFLEDYAKQTSVTDAPHEDLHQYSFQNDQFSQISKDPFFWEVNSKTKDYFAKNGFYQNKDEGFENSKRIYPEANRFLTKNMFERKLANGNIVDRDFLVYSPSQGALFCGPCKLFSESSSQFSDSGFSDWKHARTRLAEHENSAGHLDCVLAYKRRSDEAGRIDKQLLIQSKEEVKYWKNVLQRVVAVIKKLASRGLPLRGNDEVFGSPNNGNFMMCLELIAEFDPFLRSHIDKYGNPGRGHSSYLSSTICEELLKVMGKTVINTILEEVRDSKYFSIIVDSTPDISHTDQLSIILRYVQKSGEVKERFLEFLENCGHKGEQLADAVFKFLNDHGLDIQNCRGQSFDNASNMSGAYSGLQARLKQVNPLIFYVPCSAHSLNLVGSSAAECCKLSKDFFALLQLLYNFFSVSTHRWAILQSYFHSKSLSLKTLSNTRWSAREEACKSLNRDYKAIVQALEQIINDEDEKKTTRNQAKGILRALMKQETTFMASFWGVMLDKFNTVSEKVQSPKMNVATVVQLYNSLISFVQENAAMFNFYKISGETNHKAMLSEVKSMDEKYERTRKPKRFFDESDESEDDEQDKNSKDKRFQEDFDLIIRKLLTDLENRVKVYNDFLMRFLFLSNLSELNPEEINNAASNLQKIYEFDIEASPFVIECIHLKGLLHQEKFDEALTLSGLHTLLISKGLLDLYPNVNIALQIYLSTPASNCSAERSFSTLSRIKNCLRSTTSQDRLNHLAVLTIENDLTTRLDFEDVITEFANTKVRRVKLI